jgi:hypothetical protein
MNPNAAKALQKVLSTTISDYEKLHGEIKTPDKGTSKNKIGTNVRTPYS